APTPPSASHQPCPIRFLLSFNEPPRPKHRHRLRFPIPHAPRVEVPSRLVQAPPPLIPPHLVNRNPQQRSQVLPRAKIHNERVLRVACCVSERAPRCRSRAPPRHPPPPGQPEYFQLLARFPLTGRL